MGNADTTSCFCIWCGGQMASWMTLPDWRRPGVPELHYLYWCDACDFGQISPRPAAREIAAFYEIDHYYTHGDSAAAIPASFLDRLRVHLAWRADRSDALTPRRVFGMLPQRGGTDTPAVCDLGCGDGTTLAGLRELGCNVVGVEPDPAARRIATARGLDVRDGLADSPSLPAGLHPHSFDAVLMSHVLEHCLDPLQSLINAKVLLRPGGALLCEVPNNAAIGLAWSQAAWRWLDVPRHLNFFTVASLSHAAAKAGFSITALSHTGYLRQFTSDWINEEQRIAQSLLSRPGGAIGRATPLTSGRSWAMLLRTAFARRARKYDSMWMLAHLPKLDRNLPGPIGR